MWLCEPHLFVWVGKPVENMHFSHLLERYLYVVLRLSTHDCIDTKELPQHNTTQYYNTHREVVLESLTGNTEKCQLKFEHSRHRNRIGPQVEIIPDAFSIHRNNNKKSLLSQFLFQCVHPRPSRRTAATAVTRLPATFSPTRLSSSTSVTRATLWRETTSSSPARTASGTAPCRLAADLHKVCYRRNHVHEVWNLRASYSPPLHLRCVPQTRSRAPHWVSRLCLSWRPQPVLWRSSCS